MRNTIWSLAVLLVWPTLLRAPTDEPTTQTSQQPAAIQSADPQQDDPQQDELPTADDLNEMELMEIVARLQAQLQSQQVPERDAAEQELERLGPRVLDFLEPEDDTWTTDGKTRLQRVRGKLESLAVARVTRPSLATLQGTMTLEEVIDELKRQTGNNVQLPEGLPDQFLATKLQMSVDKQPFWVALNSVLKQANFDVDVYGGVAGTLILTPQRPEIDANGNPVNIQRGDPPNTQASIFDVRINRIDSTRNLVNPALSHSTFSMLVRWEPRVRPISIDVPLKELKAIDEFDNEVAVSNPEMVLSGIVQPEIPEVEFSIPLKLVDRQIENLKSITAKVDAVLPGRIETFRFRDLEDVASGTQQRKAGAIVTYAGSRQNDDVWGVSIRLGFDETNRALESHQSWVYQNEIYLEDDQGNRIDYLGMESAGGNENEIGIQYFFDVDPNKYSLVYRTPAAIVEVPVIITLKMIPLP